MKKFNIIFGTEVSIIILCIMACLAVVAGIALPTPKVEPTLTEEDVIAIVGTNLDAGIDELYATIAELQKTIGMMDSRLAVMDEIITEYRRMYLERSAIQEEIEVIKQNPVNRAGGRSRMMWVTAYDLSVESCGKPPSHPEYGITASGEYVKDWFTIAAGPELPFGTEVYIPYFQDKPNGGIFTVKDRGGAIKNGCLDVYIEDHKACDQFGRQKLEVYVLGKN